MLDAFVLVTWLCPYLQIFWWNPTKVSASRAAAVKGNSAFEMMNKQPRIARITRKAYSSPVPACHVPHLLLNTGALKTTEGKVEVPSLDKEGWLRPLRKCREASVAGADGVVGSSHRISEVERTTPFLMFRPTGLTLRAAPPKERDHLLDGAASPPLPRRGLRLSRRLSQTPVSSGRLVGNVPRHACGRSVLTKSSEKCPTPVGGHRPPLRR